MKDIVEHPTVFRGVRCDFKCLMPYIYNIGWIQAPRPAAKWLGVYNATGEPPRCMQFISQESWTLPTVDNREDCLYLNVFRPKEPHNKIMPVIVYLLGGAYLASMREQKYHPGWMMDHDVILVEPFFRLNAFGLLTLGDDVIPGNFMFKDQTMALEWVKANIASFGGNPDRVILFGESSGATATQCLLSSPLSRDLVHGGISYSGVMNHFETVPWDGRTQAVSLRIIDRIGCKRNNSQAILNCLQDVDAKDLVMATATESVDAFHPLICVVIEPKTAESPFFTEDPLLNPSDKPYIVSFTNGELINNYLPLRSYPQAVESIKEDVKGFIENWLREQIKLKSSVREKADQLIQRYSLLQPGLTEEELSINLAAMMSDLNFVYSSIHTAKVHKGPVWLNRHEYKPDQVTRIAYPFDVASHSMQTDSLFNRTGAFPWSSQPSERDVIASKRLIEYVVNFAYHGDPTPPGSPIKWKQFKTNEIFRTTKNGDFHGDQQFVGELFQSHDFWKSIIGW